VDSDRLRLVDRLATESPDLPRSIESHIPQDLETIVLKAVARDPADRYATADALAEDLRRFLADRPILARRHSRTEQLWRWCRRNPALATATVIAAACLFAVAVVSSVYAVRLREERQVANNRLFHSLITQARANRRSHGIGQRFESLKTLDEAAALAGNLSVSDSEMLELRNEVIACLPLTDLHVAKAVPDGYRTTTTNIDFDAELQNFVRIDLEGTASLRRVADNVEIGNVPVKNWRERQPVLSPNGQFLAIGGDSTQVWHITNETQVLLIDEPQAVGFPAFCPDGTAVAIGHKKGLVRIHDLPSGRVVKELQVGQDPDYIAFHPLKPQLAVRRSSGIGVFDLNSGAKLVELAIPGGQRPWWSPDGSAISSEVDSDHSIAIWSVSANRMIGRLAGHTQSGVRHVVHSSGDLSASCSWDSRLILWNPRTGQQLLQHPWDAQGNVRLQFDRRGQRLAADVAGGQLRLWEVAAPLGYRTLVRDPLLEKAELYSCSFSPKHDLLACTMADGIAFFETSSGRFLALMKSALKNDATFEPDGSLLGNSIANGQVRWSISPGPEPGTLHISAPQLLPLPRSSFQVSCSADGRVIASAQEWGAVVRREEFGDCLIPLTPHRQAWFVAASPRGDWVATACHRSTDVYVKVWNARTGELAADLPVTLRSLPVFSPDGRWLATWGDGCRLWRVGTWEEGPKIDGRECAFSPDGRILAVETGMGAIRLLNPNSGAEFARLENPNRDHASFLAFSRDGAGLATACHDAFAVHIWDLRAIRGELAKRQLDWNLPPYPLAEEPANTPPIQLIVDPSNAKAPELKDDPEYWLEVALEHRKARRWHELIVVCTKIIDLAPNDVEAWNLRGIAYRKLVKIDDAMASFEHALELYPANPALSDNLAMLLATCPDVRKRDPHRALELAKIAIKSFPDDGSVWNTLGIVHYRLGHWNEAGSCLEKAMRLREGFKSWDLFFLAMTNQKLNRAQEARKLYDQAVQWMEKNEPQHEELLRFRAEAKDTLGIK
jgi:WD40 repeat protein/Tfp pilus assembly protein PilF